MVSKVLQNKFILVEKEDIVFDQAVLEILHQRHLIYIIL